MRNLFILLLLTLTTTVSAQSIKYKIVGVENDSTILDVCGTVEVKYKDLHGGKVKMRLGVNKFNDVFVGEYDEYEMGEFHIHMKLKKKEYTICIHHNTMRIQLKDGTILTYVVRMIEDKTTYCH